MGGGGRAEKESKRWLEVVEIRKRLGAPVLLKMNIPALNSTTSHCPLYLSYSEIRLT